MSGRIGQETLVGFDKTARRHEAIVGGAVAACEMLHHLPNRRTKAALEVDEGAILVEQDRTDWPDLRHPSPNPASFSRAASHAG